MTEHYFVDGDEKSRKRPYRIINGFFFKTIIYEDGEEIVIEKKNSSSANPKQKIPRR